MGTSDRKPYESALVLDQAFLDACSDNRVNDLRFAIDIETPGQTIRVSDRHMFVGENFYVARTRIPIIKKTLGDYLSTVLELSELSLVINNSDGKFNNLMPEGADFSGWAGKRVLVRVGLRDVEATFTTIFDGTIANEGGVMREVDSFTVKARNKFDELNQNFPNAVFKSSVFPNLTDDLVNVVSPVIYGDWTTNVEPGGASIPAFVVNGADDDVNGEVSHTNNLQLVISENDLLAFDTTQVYWKGPNGFVLMDAGDITNVAATNRTFEIIQDNNTVPDPLEPAEKYKYNVGDEFFVKVRGEDLGTSSDNVVGIARDLLINEGGLSASDFDANWNTYLLKASPAGSDIANIKARAWFQEPRSVIETAISLLEQVRLEIFIDRNLKLKINSLHTEDWETDPTFNFRNWDIVKNTFRPSLDLRNHINRAKALFNFVPNRREVLNETVWKRNQPAITQNGRENAKRLVYPNLYIEADVEAQLENTLRITSAYLETVSVSTTWRALLLDVGDFVKINVDIEGTKFTNVPAMIREIGYDPAGLKLPMRLWSFQMLPYGAYNPGHAGIVGGSTATITDE